MERRLKLTEEELGMIMRAEARKAGHYPRLPDTGEKANGLIGGAVRRAEGTKKEQKIYDILLEIGPCTKADLDKYLGLEKNAPMTTSTLRRLRVNGRAVCLKQPTGHPVWKALEEDND